jgi:cytochrome o ubiquinol oxidase subunit III
VSTEASGHMDTGSLRVFGFWVYVMSDCILFASLFVAYAVLHGSTAGGPSVRDVISLPGVLVETMCLLSSSFTCGLASLAMHRGDRGRLLLWLSVTFVLGAAFVSLEGSEFHRLMLEGSGPWRSAGLSAFFTLVGTHGLHVSCGLLWMLILAVQIGVKGLTPTMTTRVRTLSLFWHFLDIVWVCVFSFVYLAGALPNG